MGTLDDGEDLTEQRYEELCLDLNLDNVAKDEAWQSFTRIGQTYTLEGDSLHWLSCALYVACRRSVPTVSDGAVEGNCVSLTRLLRSANLNLINFFSKMKKWADMANLSREMRDKVERLERNYVVSKVIFQKLRPIFLDIFRDPDDDPPKQPRSRKQRHKPCTPSDVFSFCWNMFVQVKGNFPAISDDLVNSYHLLLCCIDWFYANALLNVRTDLLNPSFSGLPGNYNESNFRPPVDVPCIIQLLCDKHEGLIIEAKGIKEHWWKPYIKKLFDKKILKGKSENLTGVLESHVFEGNFKAIKHAYEAYVLSVGDFDERIFLVGVDVQADIGSPISKNANSFAEQNLQEIMQLKRIQSAYEPSTFSPSTPLTGRRYLKDKIEAPITPVSTATQSVSRLQALLAGRKTCPGDTLIEIFRQCAKNPHDGIVERIKQMGEIFCQQYAKPSENEPRLNSQFAKQRLQLGESLYYKTLEHVVSHEQRLLKSKKKPGDLSNLLEQDIFHKSLFACCLEIVIFSYNSQRTFPWIVDIFDLSAYQFYKVIEILIRAEDGLSRDVVKYLNHIEESILDSLAWRSESPLWAAITESEGAIYSCEDVSLPHQLESDGGATSSGSSTTSNQMSSPAVVHPALRRITATGESKSLLKRDLLTSPTSAADRYASPSPGSAKRRLFGSGPELGSAVTVKTEKPETKQKTQIITLQQTFVDGKSILIPVQIPAQAPSAEESGDNSSTEQPSKPKKTGSLALFFRKVYHLASVRLRHLCEQLDVSNELRSQIWTCFEHTLVKHGIMLKDRHLDQLLMCSVYIMGKVTGKTMSFQDIMRCYRLQPQAKSHIYRSVLLERKSSRNNSPNEDSQANGQDDDKKKSDKLAMRSTSTLPGSGENSQPATPTGLIGTQSSFENEDRGDLIRFYNKVYVKEVKEFAMKFSQQSQERNNQTPLLSPLPMVRSHPTSPRRVSTKHSVYISPIKQTPYSLTPHNKLQYCFSRSPAKDLQVINNMIRSSERRTKYTAGKRLLVGDDAKAEGSPAKMIPRFSRLQEIISDRKEANGAL